MKKFVLWILTFVWLGFWNIFAQNILPDSAEISVKDPITMWEATNLKVTILNNNSKMTSYNGTILIQITEENWTRIKDSERVLPGQWRYTFLPWDLWEKEFQKWLEIKKEWTFYIEISDLNEEGDRILWKQLIHVIGNNTINEIKNIEIVNPIPNANLVWDKLEIIWTTNDLSNSEVIIYIDDQPIWTTRADPNWVISYTVWNITAWQHSLLLEIPDLAWNILWKSDKIFFTSSPAWDSWIKEVIINPENWLMIWDMTNVIVYTDEIIESVKMKLSDRSENDSMVMNKVWIWEFNQNVRLIWSGEIYLSFETSSSNNSIIQPYNNYKKIFVDDIPSISNVKVDTYYETKSADISRESSNNSNISSYLIDWRVEESDVLSWKERSNKPSFRFNDVPYNTIINLNITPYWNNQTKHWAASKTIQFVISKDQKNSCWNWTCDSWESHELCPQDCNWDWSVTIITWPSCPKQEISIRTSKIWDSYYLIRDKAEMVKKYIVYTSTTPDWKDKTKVYETSDTSYEYPFDHNSEEDVFAYFRIVWICEDWEELELTWATKVQVWPTENFFLLICLTLLIYSWIKLFRQTE